MSGARWSYLIPIAIFSMVCSVGLLAGLHLFDIPVGGGHIAMLVYFTLLTAVLHTWQERGLVSDPKGFVTRFMGGMVIKMMLTLMILLVAVILLPKGQALPIALPFMGLYLAYLSFSTVRLSTLLRKHGGT